MRIWLSKNYLIVNYKILKKITNASSLLVVIANTEAVMVAKYPLTILLGVRERRYKNALVVQNQKQQVLLHLRQEVSKKKQELSEFLLYREIEIERRYQAIVDQVKTQQELSDFNLSLGLLYVKESELQAKIDELQQQVQEAIANVNAAKAVVTSSYKDWQKLEHHQKQWLFTQKQIEAYKADLELDDFITKPSDF